MKSDAEVRRYMKERSKGRTQEQAAAAAGMRRGTARKYARAARVPSQLKQPRTYRTHANPFTEEGPWVVAQLERDPALHAKTLFGLLVERSPGRYRAVQLRTFQRHVAAWWLEHGPAREVIFPQVHRPGVAAQADFTHMAGLAITLGGAPFPHRRFHLSFVYSNVEAVRVCFAASVEALVEGLEGALWALGGVPRQHRTDHLGAAVRPLDAAGQAQARERYAAVMQPYGMEPTPNTLGVAHENGDIEQAHHRFKEALDQALRVRDDGRGFHVPPQLLAYTERGHYGLAGVAERVTLAGGAYRIESVPGRGTTITARLPLGHDGGDDGHAN
jgi:hypothetical protein